MDSGFQQGTDSTNDPPRVRPVAQLEECRLGEGGGRWFESIPVVCFLAPGRA